MRMLLFVAAAVLAAAPSVGATDIKADVTKRWAHKATGIVLPPSLAGLPRTRLAWFSAPDVDIASEYWSADGNETITVYLYRNVSGSVPLWADRARYYIQNLPDKYGTVTAGGLRPFTPRGQRVASGMMESYQLGKWGKSSALAVIPFNGFYAKMRVTSKTRDVAGIEALLWQAVNAFDWSSKTAQIPAVAVIDCAAPLAARAPARGIEGQDRMMAGLLGGLFASVVSSRPDKGAAPSAPTVYCREPGAATLTYGLYRADASAEHYMMALHDAGRAITVGRNGLAELIKSEIAESDGKKDAQPRYTVSFVHMDKTETFSDFDSLPLPDQAIEHVQTSRAVSVTGTWGAKAKNITIQTE